ncbi:SGNH hydrolase, partial [Marasmius fiardii PR-910]
TTGSFVALGYWNISLNSAKDEVAKGRRTIVTIQFGHNDRRAGPASLLAEHLTTMVQQVKEINAVPVLITSLIIRDFDNTGKINPDTLEPYTNATIDVAKAENTHLLDLHAASKKYCEEIGPVSAHKFNPTPADTTHLNQMGMIVFGRLAFVRSID